MVRNAIVYDYHRELAEGSVNKLRIIKRVMSGSNKFDMLRPKLLFVRGMDRVQQSV